MKITTAESSGFCFGVKNAVSTAQKVLENYDGKRKLVMLGSIVHNETVVNNLVAAGYIVCDNADDVPEGSTVIIRAHGVPPSEMEILLSKGCDVRDCTCPFVSKIQKIVRQAALAGENIIITGAKGHPEVVGICAQTIGTDVKVAVINSPEDIETLDFPLSSAIIVSQTTFSSEIFNKICEKAKNKIEKNNVFGTICNTTDSRQREAASISESCDSMLVIGSSHSSNSTKLFDICKGRCARTFLVNSAEEVRQLIAQGLILPDDRVGVTAGASTPEAIILEVVQEMNEDEKKTSQDQLDSEFANAVDAMAQVRRGAVVKGTITSADADFVYVDVHDKSEGRIARREFESDADFDLDKAIEDHAEVTVKVRSIKNSDQGKEIILSKNDVEAEKGRADIEDAYNNKSTIEVKITRTVKDGLIGVYEGVDIYIHRTQIKHGEVKDLAPYVGQTMEIRVTKYDMEKGRLRISGSHRVLAAEDRAKKSAEIWDSIEEGKHYKGVVRSLVDFGAFVDIGGVDGLVHVSELSWSRNAKPSDVLKVGDDIDVYVKSFDKETRKISLGYKRVEDDPYYNIEERMPLGCIVRGTVVRLTKFGAFVQLEPNLDALCHVSQISSERLEKPEDVLSIGQEVTAQVTEIDAEKRRISISIKAVAPIDPVSDTSDAETTEE
ncbi:MAG: bifunctional 4-hydroxy-3-methylbut-2-enyl diphosphate reductase/30S ribosomal protein S1 [Saccharofermentans sp.]|jgi:4-hydroxy-3-methylbut-2-enyl diphosphate reductase|nr:bifunctional 4-hydroxy-3-methylbut-2-enyl diphosphate reductase/30S ribosomal protein S1 [Mageeibacillus sp.]MCI1263412.1 bifunctional 4-hydroxy-3-methylbut-2-enyl diphosphate reductase/30S ribosomal protein S1 [Saccharofermentans sp.]MCI1274865.1 bifunctional 4-hydroxy-3-methylbut-2-enyl diphosphate reductase/30S ribosomal protein S1 [Saccharofermentans sp.]MCI2044105.1 bifunctional 4-hydroxy-3-methylbut-2-enyl diphosphate reductase/30S ribosomal protein S1 [Mageeibacillus sp.]